MGHLHRFVDHGCWIDSAGFLDQWSVQNLRFHGYLLTYISCNVHHGTLAVRTLEIKDKGIYATKAARILREGEQIKVTVKN